MEDIMDIEYGTNPGQFCDQCFTVRAANGACSCVGH